MTRFEDLERSAHLCVQAEVRCLISEGADKIRGLPVHLSMARIWEQHAINLFRKRNDLTIEQAAAKV